MQTPRVRLLQGATKLLDQQDVEALTIGALADSLRMSKSTLYKHFQNKDDLVNALVHEVCDAAHRDLDALKPDAPPLRKLEALFTVHGRHADRTPRAVLIHADALPSAAQERLSGWRHATATWCREALSAPKTPALLDAGIASALHGAVDAAGRRAPMGARLPMITQLWPRFSLLLAAK